MLNKLGVIWLEIYSSPLCLKGGHRGLNHYINKFSNVRYVKYRIVRYFSEKGHNSWGAAFNKAIKKLIEIDKFDI
ncbi:MAG: hypothetical protein ACHQJ4_03765, partial [Ignavibacteria bacterium]